MLDFNVILPSGKAKPIFVACSGTSNVGQAANNAMIGLSKEGIGGATCLAGIGAGLPGFIKGAKAAKTIVIDGCPTGCAGKIFEKYNITATQYFIVTEMGIEKNHTFDTLETETARVVDYVKSHIID